MHFKLWVSMFVTLSECKRPIVRYWLRSGKRFFAHSDHRDGREKNAPMELKPCMQRLQILRRRAQKVRTFRQVTAIAPTSKMTQFGHVDIFGNNPMSGHSEDMYMGVTITGLSRMPGICRQGSNSRGTRADSNSRGLLGRASVKTAELGYFFRVIL